MSKDKLIPVLRFPEFAKEGEWEKKKLGDCLDYLQPTEFLVSSTAYDNSFKTPVLTAGKTFILGYTNEVDNIFKEKLPVIIFDDFTTASQYVDFPFKAKSSAMKILLSKNNIDIKFSYELMQMISYEVGVHGRHWISVFSNLEVPVPENPKEQQRIASCLSSLDEVIAAHSQRLDLLKDHKKGLMQNLFPQEGEKVPKYRFKEFEKDGEWVEDKLVEIAVFVNEKLQLENVSINSYVSTENLLSDYAGVSIASKLPASGNFTKYRNGDVLISNIRPYLKKVWLADKDGACSNDVIVIRAKTKVTDIFLSCLLKNGLFISYIMKGAEGVKMPRGDKDSIREYPISYPREKGEQQKIAACLTSLDVLITAQAEKIAQLKLHKKGLMQGLFPKIND